MIIMDLLRAVFDRPILKCKVILRRRGWKFGTLFYIGNVIFAYSGAVVLLLSIPIFIMAKLNLDGPIKSENVVVKFFCEDWGLIEYVTDALFFPLFAFWGIVNFVLMLFGRGQFKG